MKRGPGDMAGASFCFLEYTPTRLDSLPRRPFLLYIAPQRGAELGGQTSDRRCCMRTRSLRGVAVAAILGALGLAPSASASPVTTNVCISVAGSGLFQYTFTLTLDNHDNTWSPGYGIGWIVFADVPTGQSPLNDFVGDPSSLPIGPWTGYSTTGGGHNGPNLSPVVEQQPPNPNIYWVPNAVGDSLTWRGTSSHLVTHLQWSNLFITGGANFINFEAMTSTGCGPSGACCTPTGCQVLSSELCTAVGGVYNGDGAQCTTCPAV